MSDREWIIHRDVVDHTPMVDSVRFVPELTIAAWVPVTREMLDDAPTSVLGHIEDRWLRPWKFPDRRGWPASFDLFPGLHRAATRVQRIAREARLRPRAAWAVLRHGEPERDEDDW